MRQLTIEDSCIKCGRCVSVCPALILTQEKKNAEIGVINLQTCIDCGQCVAICPTDSVVHSTYPRGTAHRIDSGLLASPSSLLELMRKRRSNRAFSKKPIPAEHLEHILEAANLAPTGGNRQALEYSLVTNPGKLKAIHRACIEVCDRLALELAKAENEEQKMFGVHLAMLSKKYKSGYEVIFRGATTLLLIHSKTPMSASDANLAYQNASLMAEALDVAHFYTGYLCILTSMDKESTIKNVLNIEGEIYAGMALAMPRYTFKKYVDRKPMLIKRWE